MSLITALDTAVSGLKVAQLQVQNASNNIANASDPNYTKKTAVQAPINLSAGGGGVQLVGYEREIDRALNVTYRDAISNNGLQSVANDQFKSIKDIYGISSDTVLVSSALSDFVASWQSLSAAPEDSVRQKEVVSKGDAFASEVRRIASELDKLDTSIQQTQSDSIDKVNNLLSTIADLNNQVASAKAVNEPTGNLEDQRDTSLRDLAKYVKIRVIDGDQGRVRVLTPGGFVMVDTQAVKLNYDKSTGNYQTSGGTNLNNVLSGGSLQALYNIRYDGSPATADTDPAREVLRKLKSQLGSLFTAFTTTTGTPTTFAAAYNSGTATTGELGTSFFTGTGAGDFAVNSALLAGTSTVKKSSVDSVVAALTTTTRSFSADGVSTTGTSYSGYTSTIMGLLGSAADTVKGRSDTSAAAANTYKERYANVTGVNVDQELIDLTRFQNSYAASARVISTVRDMFQVLESIAR